MYYEVGDKIRIVDDSAWLGEKDSTVRNGVIFTVIAYIPNSSYPVRADPDGHLFGAHEVELVVDNPPLNWFNLNKEFST